MENLIGMDIGGTFTDCVVAFSDGFRNSGKAPTTPHDYAEGMFGALEAAARRGNREPGQIWRECNRFVHGTTIGTNAIVERSGARVGLLTTIGHEDVLYIGRGKAAVAGIPEALLTWQQKHFKPEPFAHKRLTKGVVGRIDSAGQEVVPLDVEQARGAIRELLEEGVEAIAIGFLWSFVNPAHERAVRELVEAEAPGVFVTTSSELAPKWGEYERLNAAVLNSYLGPKTSTYLDSLSERLDAAGFAGAAGLMQCAGGYVPIDEAKRSPILTLDSGPVAGVIGSRLLADEIGVGDVIATDMGGTSFDAGILLRGQPITRDTAVTAGFEYHVARVDITSIGSGGGSIVTIDPSTSHMRVGPRSAGATPGPVCYGRGGSEPTVTDADVLLGMVDPAGFLGGESKLDVGAAERAIAELGGRIGMSAVECAAGIQKIVDNQMAEALRRVSVESGLDPRDFWIFAYGGAGPVHAGSYSRELGARGVVVPQRAFASVWSAWGASGADVVRVYERAALVREPFPAEQLEGNFAELERRAVEEMEAAGFGGEEIVLERRARMKWRFQVHEIEVGVPAGTIEADNVGRLVDHFAERYELLFGRDTAYRAAGVEISSLAVVARGVTAPPVLQGGEEPERREPAAAAARPSREVFWWEIGEHRETAIFDGAALRPGDAFEGPAIVEAADTSVVVRPGQLGRVDAVGNILIEFS